MKYTINRTFTFVLLLSASMIFADSVLTARALSISPSPHTMAVGATVQFVLSGATGTPKWTSSNTAIVTITNKGFATARAPGIASISVRSSGNSTSALVTVTGTVPPPPPVNCVLSNWTLYNVVLGACVNGLQTRTETWTRTIVTPPSNGGTACGPLSEDRITSQACSVEPPSGFPLPTAFWELGEASGTRSDSRSSHHLTDNNTVTSAVGKVGTAALFSRTNAEDLSIVDNAALSGGDRDYTVAGWVWLDSIEQYMAFVTKAVPGNAEFELGLSTSPTTRFFFQVSADGSTWPSATARATAGPPTLGTWNFLVAWHDATANTLNLRVNNGSVDTVSHTSGIFDGPAAFRLGSWGGYSHHNGRLDQVGIWPQVLTDAEQTWLWNSGAGRSWAAIAGAEVLPPTITTTTLSNATVGTPYTACVSATGGTPPYVWDKTAGVYPAGLSFTAGCFSGTPTGAETQAFTLRVTDSASGTDSQALSLTVVATPTPPAGCTVNINGDLTTVQNALNAATSGQTICINAGTWGWSNQVLWTAPSNVTLKGAGSLTTVGGGNATVILDDFVSTGGLFEITTNATGTFRLAGITFQGRNSGASIKSNGVLKIVGNSKLMRIDHVTFNMRTYSPDNTLNTAIRFFGWVYGVVDSSVFELNGGSHALKYAHDAYDGDSLGTGDASWAAATQFGTSAFVYAENNVLNHTGANGAVNDCNAGGRFVVRYNAINGAQMQTHPTGGGGRGRGCRASEIYGNTINGSSPPADPLAYNVYFLSSGPSLIWGNVVDSSYKNFVTLHSMRRNNGTYPESATPAGWGYCGTSFTGVGSNWDQNSVAATGYACLDQPGRGDGDRISGDFPNAINDTTGTIAWPNQALEPVREWLNTFTPAPGWGGSFWGAVESEVLAANRDYYLYTASFTGATGNGAGTIAARPATCTTGVAYWATNEGEWNSTNGATPDGKMYVCTATNTWTARYGDASNISGLPYTYPHPSRQ